MDLDELRANPSATSDPWPPSVAAPLSHGHSFRKTLSISCGKVVYWAGLVTGLLLVGGAFVASDLDRLAVSAFFSRWPSMDDGPASAPSLAASSSSKQLPTAGVTPSSRPTTGIVRSTLHGQGNDEAIVLIPKVLAPTSAHSAAAIEEILQVDEQMGPDASLAEQASDTVDISRSLSPRVRLGRPWVGGGRGGLAVRVTVHNDGAGVAEGYLFGVATLIGPKGERQDVASHSDIEVAQLADFSNGGRGAYFKAKRVTVKELNFETSLEAVRPRFVQLKIVVSKHDQAGPGMIASYGLGSALDGGAEGAAFSSLMGAGHPLSNVP